MEILWEKRPEGTVNETSRKNLGISSLAFPLHESARETSCRIEFFFVVDLKRHEVNVILCILCRSHRSEQHRTAHLDHH